MRIISKAMWALLAALVLLWVGGGTPLEATNTRDACYEDVVKDVIQKQTREIKNMKQGEPNWSEWTFWDNSKVVDDGRARGPLPHNDKQPGKPGYREYRYVVVGSKTVKVKVDCPPEETTTTTEATTTTVAETTTTVAETTTTTEPEVTTTQPETTTTEPLVDITATTAPPVITGPATPPSTERLGDVCFQHITGGPTLAVGDFVYYGPQQVPEATGSTNISLSYCGPIVETTPAVPTGTLPETGASNWMVALIATMCLGLGGSALWAARR